jgi:hypothetical protein
MENTLKSISHNLPLSTLEANAGLSQEMLHYTLHISYYTNPWVCAI